MHGISDARLAHMAEILFLADRDWPELPEVTRACLRGEVPFPLSDAGTADCDPRWVAGRNEVYGCNALPKVQGRIALSAYNAIQAPSPEADAAVLHAFRFDWQ